MIQEDKRARELLENGGVRGSGARHSWEPMDVPLAQGTQVVNRPLDESLEDDLDEILREHDKAEQAAESKHVGKRQADLH
eukprot:9306959-Alexandrium_andersonii.AAC.1